MGLSVKISRYMAISVISIYGLYQLFYRALHKNDSILFFGDLLLTDGPVIKARERGTSLQLKLHERVSFPCTIYSIHCLYCSPALNYVPRSSLKIILN